MSPKESNTAAECEDAIAIGNSGSVIALCDGASSSIYAGEWARRLAQHYVKTPASTISDGWLAPIRSPFNEWASANAQSWNAAAKLRQGVFATLLGVRIDVGSSRYRALAIGDTCLFHVSHGRLRKAFPLKQSEAFLARPFLVSSRPDQPAAELSSQQAFEGQICPDSLLFGMTDALAAWFLLAHSRQERPWNRLLQIEGNEDLARLGEQLRADGVLNNDDLALVIVELDE
jgi:hypothetical protein